MQLCGDTGRTLRSVFDDFIKMSSTFHDQIEAVRVERDRLSQERSQALDVSDIFYLILVQAQVVNVDIILLRLFWYA